MKEHALNDSRLFIGRQMKNFGGREDVNTPVDYASVCANVLARFWKRHWSFRAALVQAPTSTALHVCENNHDLGAGAGGAAVVWHPEAEPIQKNIIRAEETGNAFFFLSVNATLDISTRCRAGENASGSAIYILCPLLKKTA